MEHGSHPRDPVHGRVEVGIVSGLGLLRAFQGRGVRHSCLVPQPLATLSRRDASRSARRKRTGCVEPYVQIIRGRSTRSPALPARTEHPQGGGHGGPRSYQSFEGKEYFWARRAEGLDNSSKDFIKSTDEGSILEVATFCQSELGRVERDNAMSENNE